MLYHDKNFDKILESLKKNDDQEAFAYLYRLYFEKLCKYVFSLSGDTQQSEDIVQDTLLTLWRSRTKIDIKTSLNAYLYRSAYNNYINIYKQNKTKLKLFEELRLEVILDIESEATETNKERLKELYKIIDAMPKNRKEVFRLNKLQNYTYKEIAIMRNISERTVESHIRSALVTLRTEASNLKLPVIVSLFFSNF